LSEAYGRGIFGHSTFGVNFNQQWNTFTFAGTSGNSTEHVTFYNSMLNYEWHPFGGLNWTAQAGLQQQRGGGNNQDLFAVRTYLNWTVGKLETHLGYEHDDQDFSGQIKKRDFVFLRIRRNF
jgi:predicted porin